jgi:hypothetical protein
MSLVYVMHRRCPIVLHGSISFAVISKELIYIAIICQHTADIPWAGCSQAGFIDVFGKV